MAYKRALGIGVDFENAIADIAVKSSYLAIAIAMEEFAKQLEESINNQDGSDVPEGAGIGLRVAAKRAREYAKVMREENKK